MDSALVDLLKLLVILGVTVLLLLKKWDLGLVLLLNTFLVAVLFAYPIAAWAGSVLRGAIAIDTLNLAGAVYLVLVLAELMRRTHAMEDMVAALQGLVPDSRITLAVMPLLIGLMPMLGGAMFSAPMVNEVGDRIQVSPERKTFVNYWFRHAMEYVFPLYPSLLMMAALLRVSVYEFVQVSWPLAVVALLAGVLWGVAGIGQHTQSASLQAGGAARRMLLRSTWPLVLVVLAVVVLRLPMVLSLIGVSMLYVAVTRVSPRHWGAVLRRSFPLGTFSAIFGVMIFKHVVEDAAAVSRIPQALSALGLPPLLIAFTVPMLVGLLTGTAAAALALSVPVVTPLLTGGQFGVLDAGIWLFVGGFSGVLLSPLHLCLALTKEYFEANWGPLYARIVPSVALVIVAAGGLLLL